MPGPSASGVAGDSSDAGELSSSPNRSPDFGCPTRALRYSPEVITMDRKSG